VFLIRKFTKYALYLFLIGLLALAGLYFYMKDDLPSVQSLKDLKWQTPMQIFTIDGKLISQFGQKKRLPLTLEQMPQQLIDAILATEDDRFYAHFGVDPIGMGRAILGQLMGQNKGGASTITMQVARNFFLTREQTYLRKIREIFLSFHIESLLSKDEILELYMNKIELGHRSFGFGAAAQTYYGKDVNDLTLAQIAVLAGLPKAPSTNNPIYSPRRAQERRSVVLKRMFVSNYISAEEYEIANTSPITGKRHGAEIEVDAPYVAEMAHQEMLDLYGKEEAYSGGYKVFTTIPAKLQIAAQQAVIDNLHHYDQRHGYRGPVSSLRAVSEEEPLTKPEDVEKNLLPLTPDEITTALKNTTAYQSLVPAVVVDVEGQFANIILKNNVKGTIHWAGMSWAREFIHDNKQGPAPETAEQIINYGDVILVKALADGSYQLSQLPTVSGALVALSPDNGAIQAAVGGYSFKQSQFNRVTQAERQVGSNIKPFLYSAALDNNFTLATLVNDAPINQWDRKSGVVWRPKNSPEVYAGPIRVRIALAQSKNVVAVRLLRAVGLSNVIDHLSSFGFAPDKLPREESLALGSASLTPIEVAAGFATFANGGFLIEPYLIERIEDSFGNVLFQAQPKLACDPCITQRNIIDDINDVQPLTANTDTTNNNNLVEYLNSSPTYPTQLTEEHELPVNQAERALSPQNAFLVTQALNSAIWDSDWSTSPGWNGTGYRARTLKRKDLAGKTGTTNQAKDAWFSGYSRRLVTTSWIGFDDHQRDLGRTAYNNNLDKNQTTGKEFGAKSAQPAWIAFMKTALEDIPFEPFQQPDNIISVRIDKASGKLTDKTDKTSLFEYFILGTEPKEYINSNNHEYILNGKPTKVEEELF
jgi:penicillin-binding protein 1A